MDKEVIVNKLNPETLINFKDLNELNIQDYQEFSNTNTYNKKENKELNLLNFVKLKNTNSYITCYGRPSVKDLKSFKLDYKINLVVTLQGEGENPGLIKAGCNDNNIDWLHFPEMGAGLFTLKKIKNKLCEFMINLYNRLCSENIYMFVHCAAGVHRTGVFLYGILRMSGESEQNAYIMLKEIRHVTHKNVGDQRIKDFESEIVTELIKNKINNKKDKII